MNKIKSILALLLCASMLFVLCACGADADKGTDADETKPDTTVADTTAEDTEPEAKAILTVKVLDGDGNAVEGAMVQLCNESNCFTAFVDAEGNGVFLETVVPAITSACYLSLPYLPEGYEYTGDVEVYLEEGATEYTLEISKVG